jgi:hypothetical protein
MYCPLPPATCMYCRVADHTTKYYPTLMTKIQEKGNQNNQNVQFPHKLEMMGKISILLLEEEPKQERMQQIKIRTNTSGLEVIQHCDNSLMCI